MKMCAKLAGVAVAVLTTGWAATSTAITVKPTSLVNFMFLVNSASNVTTPASQTLTVTLPSTAPVSTVISASVPCPAANPLCQTWLAVAPSQGHSPLTLTITANPTGLPPGSYPESITITTNPNVGSILVPVTLLVTNPPSVLSVVPGPNTTMTPATTTTPATLTYSYTTGSLWSQQPSELDVSTNGGIIPFNVAVSNATGTAKSIPVWLRVDQKRAVPTPGMQTSGVAASGNFVPIMVSLDQTSVQLLTPGATYTGLVTFTPYDAAGAAGTPYVVDVTLTVSAGAPELDAIYPLSVIQAPTSPPVIFIRGGNFFYGSTSATIATDVQFMASDAQCTQSTTPVPIPSSDTSVLSQNLLQVTITNGQTLFATPANWCICVSNTPGAVGETAPTACAPLDFAVTSSSQMTIASVLNAASYVSRAIQIGKNSDPVGAAGSAIAPGEIISIFGQNMGPATAQNTTPTAAPAIMVSTALDPAGPNTAGLFTTPLQFSVATSNTNTTAVQVIFTGDANNSAAETLDLVAAYISAQAQVNGIGTVTSPLATQTGGGTTLTLNTGSIVGSGAAITVTYNPAAVLLGLTAGNTITTAKLFPSLNTALLVPAPPAASTPLSLNYTLAGVTTPVTIDFTSDANLGPTESLTHVVNYINQNTTQVVAALAGGTQITLSALPLGSGGTISVNRNAASDLLGLTQGGAMSTVTGTQSYPTQLTYQPISTDASTQSLIQVSFSLGGSVFAAPIIMASSNQINAMVPFEVSTWGRGALPVITVTDTTTSPNPAPPPANNSVVSTAIFPNVSFPNPLVLVDEDPGIFTLGGLGSGPAAILNYNSTNGAYSINSVKNPAPLGSTIVIYATGLGKLVTPLTDTVTASTADKVADPVQVTIAGQPALVTYAGTSPGSIAGLVQINAVVLPTVTPGNAVPVTIAGGDANTARQSQAGVTLAISKK
jgi:uncharacterized protein (TIGR03437 family)